MPKHSTNPGLSVGQGCQPKILPKFQEKKTKPMKSRNISSVAIWGGGGLDGNTC